jgi:hypothetical protein
MITVDRALGIYTDKVNAGDDIDMGYFKRNLSKEDYKEFRELIPFINLLKSAKITRKFEEIFDKVDKYKETVYPSSNKNKPHSFEWGSLSAYSYYIQP